jgi:hypothetical protein
MRNIPHLIMGTIKSTLIIFSFRTIDHCRDITIGFFLCAAGEKEEKMSPSSAIMEEVHSPSNKLCIFFKVEAKYITIMSIT